MLPTRQGAFRLFRFAGIDVFLHWSWFVVALIEVNSRGRQYSSITWNILEYLSLFLIVLLHEFGHSLACRSVGGKADQIVLWPLGGVAYVAPPQRPSATLWSIAAGPLVNVILVPILGLFWFLAPVSVDNVPEFAQAIFFINAVLLVFNLLPIYPLDGGQILRSLLWFAFGRTKSLLIASILGFIGIAALLVIAVFSKLMWSGESIWPLIMAAFVVMNCWRGLMEARALARIDALPRHTSFICPTCKNSPPQAPLWLCGSCHHRFDTFATHAVCPNCSAQFVQTACYHCGNTHPFNEWIVDPTVPPKIR